MKDVIKQATDMHVHIGPEIIPRKFTAEELAKAEEGKLKGIALKSHFFSTVPFAKQIEKKYNIKLIGSITLNNYVGGMNANAVRASAELGGRIIVWFPTINAENFLKSSEYEIRPEWVNNKDFKPRLSKDVSPVKIIENNQLTKETIEVLNVIKGYDCILATGHISSQEAEMLVKKAKEIGIKRIIVTHPIYQLIDMPVEKQKELADLGAYLEMCVSMYTIDKIPIEKIVEQIKFVGAKRVILSSDVGQTFSKNSSEALEDFSNLLLSKGITEDEIKQMLINSPNKLIL